MNTEPALIPLTQLQLSHAIVAIQTYMEFLLKKSEENPEGGEHEDYLIAQSILNSLTKVQTQSRKQPIP